MTSRLSFASQISSFIKHESGEGRGVHVISASSHETVSCNAKDTMCMRVSQTRKYRKEHYRTHLLNIRKLFHLWERVWETHTGWGISSQSPGCHWVADHTHVNREGNGWHREMSVCWSIHSSKSVSRERQQKKDTQFSLVLRICRINSLTPHLSNRYVL